MAIPDEDLHPVATGRAMDIVKEHENAKADHTLYSGWFCPFVQRAWITLEEKKIPYTYKEINPYRKEKEFLKLNPRGLVPTLGCSRPDGSTAPLIESSLICEYLDETFPDQVPLLPKDPFLKAKLKVSIDYVTTRIIPAFHRFLQWTKEKPYSIEIAKKEFQSTLLTWIKDADAEGPFFAGEEMSMVDVQMAPWAIRLWIFEHFKGIPATPAEGQGGDDEKAWARWRKWLKAVESRESVTNTMSDREHYLPIYERYHNDEAQSELAKATRQGRGVP